MSATPQVSTQSLNEDDIYRTSSQYRVWSFSPERLASLRRTTHELAIDRIRAQQSTFNGSTSNGHAATYLTEAEELRLVQRYCEQIRVTSDHLKWPVNVKATAVQYLRRFYVSNSVMTYPPKEIYKTALFLASKTEATHITLSDYSRRISSKAEDILAPEYKLMQALRFTLDVKQPFRGLKGVLMELLNMVDGLPETHLREELQAVDGPGNAARTTWKRTDDHVDADVLPDRIQAAYHAARAILDNEALMTDVYFLYTPSQIMLAGMALADPELAEFYISTKITKDLSLKPRILATIRSCGQILQAKSTQPVLTKDERAAMEERLERCRDPSTRDLVKAHQIKQAGDAANEDKIERRKLERERQEQEGHDLFGPSIRSNGVDKGG